MALERQSIEKKDFPIGRRGYDPEAVDAHLRMLADQIEEVKSSSRRRSETLASAASEQVRAIVEAAETSAAEIQRQAEDEAREIRDEASTEARATREEAVTQAREYVGRVSESTTVMLQRLDAMESELSALVEALRTGANRLNADLQLLEGNLGDITQSVGPGLRFQPEAAAEPSGDRETAAPAVEPVEAEAVTEPEPPAPEPDVVEPDVAEPGVEVAAEAAEPAVGAEDSEGGAEDSEGARLIALNMALNGSPREETDRYLAENFELSDRRGLLDEVYASVDG